MALKVGELYATLGIDMAPFNTALAGAQTKLAAVGQQMASGGLAKGGFAYKGFTADLAQTFKKGPAGGGLFPQVDLSNAKALQAEIGKVSDAILDYQKRMLNVDPLSQTFKDMQADVGGLGQRLGLLNNVFASFAVKAPWSMRLFENSMIRVARVIRYLRWYVAAFVAALFTAVFRAAAEFGTLDKAMAKIHATWAQILDTIAVGMKPGLERLASYLTLIADQVTRAFTSAGALTSFWGPLLKSFGTGAGLALAELAKVLLRLAQLVLPILTAGFYMLYGVLWLINFVVDRVVQGFRILLEFLHIIPKATFLDLLIDKLQQAMVITDVYARMTKAAAEKAAQGIVDVIQKRREDAAAIRDQIAAQIGFIGITELWNKAMVAGARAGLRTGAPVPALTPGNLPGTDVTRKIYETLKAQERDQKEVLRVIKERLGTYAAGA
jgi:hypothetical protein